MDIKIERRSGEGNNSTENYIRQTLQKYFKSYPFIESVKVYFRGLKHPSKKIKLHMHLKGKDVFAEANGANYDTALENAMEKIHPQIQKYKSKRYKRASWNEPPIPTVVRGISLPSTSSAILQGSFMSGVGQVVFSSNEKMKKKFRCKIMHFIIHLLHKIHMWTRHCLFIVMAV